MALTQISTEGIKNGTITGSDLATNVDLVDNQKLRFGTGNDLEIYFNGTNSVIAHVPNSGDLILQAPTGETSIRCNASSSVDLYYDNNKKFETTSTGATLTGVLATDSVDISSSGNLSLPDNRKIYIGTGNDTRVYHNGADLYIDNDTGGTWIGLDSGATFGVGTGPAASPQALKAVIGAQVELMHNGTKKFDTTSYGTRTTGNHTITGQLTLETDGQKAVFGAGDDLQIYHDGNNSRIENSTGQLKLKAVTAGTSVQMLGAGDEMMVQAISNGAVELYHDDIKKFETTSGGAIVYNGTGDAQLNIRGGSSDGRATLQFIADDNAANDDNFRLRHDANNDFYLQNYASGGWETNIKAVGNGNVELYYNNVKKLETTSNGIKLNDSTRIGLGDNEDLQIYHDGSHSDIHDSGSGNLRLRSSKVQILNEAATEQIANFIPDGAVELYYDNSKKFESTSEGVSVAGRIAFTGTGQAIDLLDDQQIRLGTGDDLMIFHDGSDSHIHDNGTGQLILRADNFRVNNANNTENMIVANENGEVSLYYDDSKKFETTSGGATVLGTATITSELNLINGSTNANKYIDCGLGDNNALYIRGTSGGDSNHEVLAYFYRNGPVALYYDAVEKFTTTTNGATIDGGSNVSMDSSGNGQLKVNGSGYSGAIALDGTAMNIYHNSSSRGIVFGINETEVARFSNQGRFYVNRTSELKGGDTISVETTHSAHGGSAYIMSWKGDSDVLSIRNHGSGDYELVNNGGGNELSLYDGSGGAKLEYYDNGNYIGMVSNYAASNRAYSGTTSGSANMNVNSSGYMRRSTSSQRYKNNIREYSGKGIEILKNIIPKTWEDHEEGTTHHGFIAEEFHSAGLTTAVLYEPYIGGEEIGIGEEKGDFYGNGTPPVTKTGEALDDEVLVVDGVDQTTILAELVIAVKQLNSRLEALEK